MDIVINPITATVFSASLPLRVLLRDLLSKQAEIVFELHGEGYERSRFLLFTSESGSKLTLSIKGKPGFCLAALNSLIAGAECGAEGAQAVELFQQRAAELDRWELRTPLLDILRKPESLDFRRDGESHERHGFPILYSYESGASFAVSIRGKRGFAHLAIAQIRSSASTLDQLLTRTLNKGLLIGWAGGPDRG